MYQEVCFNRGTEAGGGVNVGHSLSPPPVILCLLRASKAKKKKQKWNKSENDMVLRMFHRCKKTP